jgi:hypothetical protein
MKIIFTCKNGHSYESKNPITTEGASRFGWKQNDTCKVCGEVIIKEDCYVNGKIVMGAIRI